MDFDIDVFDGFGEETRIDALSKLPMLQMVAIDSGEHNYLLDIDRAAAEIAKWAASEKGG